MKPIYIAPFLLALCLLASCSSGDDEPEVIVPQDATLTLSVAPGSVLTKSSPRATTAVKTLAGEAKINNICAALFKEDGSLLTSSYVDYAAGAGGSKTPDTIRISAKSITNYTYVILVNVGNKSFSTLEKLKEETFALKDIKVDNQPMCSQFKNVTLKPGANYIGSKEVFTEASEEEFLSKESIKVYRTASRIDFEKIGVTWSDENATDLKKANARFLLKRVYATQVKSHTYLTDRSTGDQSVEVKNGTDGLSYLDGKESGSASYLETLNLFNPSEDAESVIISSGSSIESEDINGGTPWRCYVTENTESGLTLPTTLILKGDILPETGEEPILKDRYFFVRLKDMKDTQEKLLPGIIRNYVIRISATITGKGSGDETYRENASAIVTVTPDDWSVEETQHEGVN
ncbi:fimbrial protein [Parabacteroides gordonii]|uniref:Tudor domain-containing protein n=1 Tax=Parabacteroides gordonii MS-1 = DSM 23371 TaxID=1203610 RepID=A0A0F5IWN3_9BACT|nr:fimbrial protein [Parabacteroides gordonii]KKB49527.1 hypothetical protein HMPREF1536_04592 [Parabacteroides gordonii MS-1 = DSM 23371]MCA5585790.1 hypothetical protein [Parabacteroides gordonii]